MLNDSNVFFYIIECVIIAIAISCLLYFCCPCKRIRTYNSGEIYINENSNNANPDELPA